MVTKALGWCRGEKSSALLLSCLLILGGGARVAADAPQDTPPGKTAEVYTVWPFDGAEAGKRQDETAKALGVQKEQDIDLGGGVAITFILMPAGKYKMGDAPGRDVTVEKPFYLGKFLVTQAQYSQVMGKNPSLHPGDTNPVDSIPWPGAADFAKKVSEQTKKAVHLPSEVQWEWACRAGTATRCYWGDDMTNMGDYCWWHDNCDMKTHPVGQKKPNAFGLYDMMGLSWEWCSDGGGPGASDHPCRGATFGSRVGMFKSTIRMVGGGPTANDRFGFRVAMDTE
jgi:formylglycine-generating enzyme required for sulfatase activity